MPLFSFMSPKIVEKHLLISKNIYILKVFIQCDLDSIEIVIIKARPGGFFVILDTRYWILEFPKSIKNIALIINLCRQLESFM